MGAGGGSGWRLPSGEHAGAAPPVGARAGGHLGARAPPRGGGQRTPEGGAGRTAPCRDSDAGSGYGAERRVAASERVGGGGGSRKGQDHGSPSARQRPPGARRAISAAPAAPPSARTLRSARCRARAERPGARRPCPPLPSARPPPRRPFLSHLPLAARAPHPAAPASSSRGSAVRGGRSGPGRASGPGDGAAGPGPGGNGLVRLRALRGAVADAFHVHHLHVSRRVGASGTSCAGRRVRRGGSRAPGVEKADPQTVPPLISLGRCGAGSWRGNSAGVATGLLGCRRLQSQPWGRRLLLCLVDGCLLGLIVWGIRVIFFFSIWARMYGVLWAFPLPPCGPRLCYGDGP